MNRRILLFSGLLSAPLLRRAFGDDASPEPSWETLKAAYAYTPAQPFPVKSEPRADAGHLLEHLTFQNGAGQTVTGAFLRPKGEGSYPCVLLLHGLTGSKDVMIRRFGRAFAARGVASLALDAALHGERAEPGNPPRPGRAALGRVMREGVVEYRQALDYLVTRKGVDAKRIGLLGYSMGAMMGAILGGVEPRVGAVALLVGGDLSPAGGNRLGRMARAALQTISPAHYIGHLRPRPVLLMNGKQDTTVPEAAAKRLHAAAKEPKEIQWVEAGHMLPPEAIAKAVEWLHGKLLKA